MDTKHGLGVGCDALALAAPGVRGLSPYQPGKPVEELERELGLHDIVKLASNENPLGPSPLGLAAAREALAEVARYPDGSGFELRAALSRKLGIAPETITLGNGSNDVLELVARAFVSPADEVVYAEHAFIVYPLVTQAIGARGVCVPARDFGHDLDAMRAAIGPATRLVFLANPNNPTGTWVGAVALRRFLESLPDHVIAVVDEAYVEYVETDAYASCLPWVAALPRLVVARTFSKAYGLAGLRVGYAVSHPDVADLMNRVRQPFNVTVPALAAARAALDDEAHLARTREVNRAGMAQLEAGLRALGLDWIPSIGNFVTVGFPRPGAEIYQALLREGVIVRPVAGYGLPSHLRVTVGTEAENARFLEALSRVL
ncbi:MAG: histidinol-phosphate transaminase [Ectothiorhodospiraceae bacterium]|nr:histidinol-phosphate transaminase [Chromatiales bacterium]MCP5156890.1 histidinol-phosphate transaminase [Ectothiorhodospiraceae bacterium]